MNKNVLLKVNNLSLGFESDEGFSLVVNDVSFEIKKGEITGLVGESGCGKTVTSLSVMNLLPKKKSKVTKGQILLRVNNSEEPVDILQLTESQMQNIRGLNIGMIFQEPMSSLNPVMKCGKQVAEAMLLHKIINKENVKSRVLELFEEVKLPEPERIYNSYPHQLSGGQRQRVMIAMAISCKPSLLIADEPTTALDVTVQKRILELIKSLQKKYEISILFITHDLGVVYNIADNIAVMYKGRIVEKGNVSEIFKNPQHPYTKGLISCRPVLNSRPARLPVVNYFLKNEEQGNHASPLANSEVSLDSQRKTRHKRIYSNPPALIVKNLTTSFVTRRNFFGKPKSVHNAVSNISFNVYEGETLGLVGESGCGKTSLGRTIMRLISPGNGAILYKGIDICNLSSSELRKFRTKIQIIFQDPYSSLTPGIQVGKAIQEPMKVHNILSSDVERKHVVVELLEKVGLEEKHYYRYPHEFSGGQLQRVCIARALALNPDFIICDEAVSSLDVSVQAQVLNLLNGLKNDFGLTYIFISHDLAVVKYMSDRVMVMQDGKIAELADADLLYKNPESHYTKTLINAIPDVS